MATGDVSITQNGGQGSIKLHPHVLALLRWCISCVWSTASELLQRILAAPLPPIRDAIKKDRLHNKSKRWNLRKSPPRQASSEHIHPVPKVECVVLHTPDGECNLDVIFVHGLYGSLGNTWRQGDWKLKYKWGPNRVPLMRQVSIPKPCTVCDDKPPPPEIQINIKNYDFCMCDYHKNNDNDKANHLKENIRNNTSDINNVNITEKVKEANTKFVEIENCDKPQQSNEDNEYYINENLYESNFIESVEILDNIEAQAQFVRDLFINQSDCDSDNTICDNYNETKEEIENKINNDDCKDIRECAIGCGCVCDKCYSTCWPKDWLQVDYPDARVISINYTSDPYLWRPIWVKESKRLHLDERAEQMTRQLLDLGVGRKPIIWVGHSKGGLFIKQIYVNAFEAYMKLNKDTFNKTKSENEGKCNISNNISSCKKINLEANQDIISNVNKENLNLIYNKKPAINEDSPSNNEIKSLYNMTYKDEGKTSDDSNKVTSDAYFQVNYTDECILNEQQLTEFVKSIEKQLEYTSDSKNNESDEKQLTDFVKTFEKELESNMATFENDNIIENLQYIFDNSDSNSDFLGADDSVNKEDESIDDKIDDERRASLWLNSSGFMFYSVPHRGSPLADINVAPLMLRSIELLEISKNCSLVLELQEKWLTATARAQPVVRSLVETCRTLMTVLWLRIVSVESADPGIGALCGVSLDHREICKPSSRSCLLYTELLNLIHAALNKCVCKQDKAIDSPSVLTG